MIQMICLLLAVIFALIATAGVPSPPRFNYLAFALAMLSLSFLVGAVPGLR